MGRPKQVWLAIPEQACPAQDSAELVGVNCASRRRLWLPLRPAWPETGRVGRGAGALRARGAKKRGAPGWGAGRYKISGAPRFKTAP